MTDPDWLRPENHARCELGENEAPFDKALHLARYRWAVQNYCSPDFRVLDLGCGVGFGTRILGQSGADTVGVDFAEEALTEANRLHAGLGTRFVCADLTNPDPSGHLGCMSLRPRDDNGDH